MSDNRNNSHFSIETGQTQPDSYKRNYLDSVAPKNWKLLDVLEEYKADNISLSAACAFLREDINGVKRKPLKYRQSLLEELDVCCFTFFFCALSTDLFIC